MIYFLQDATGHIKIGYTAKEDPAPRVADLQTGNPHGIEVLLAVPGDRLAEDALHHRFAAARAAGEWFRPVPALVRFILAEAVGQTERRAPARPTSSAVSFLDPLSGPGDAVEQHQLVCPHCGCENVHHLERDPLAGACLPWSVRRRSFWCEDGCEFSLEFSEHKGVVYVTPLVHKADVESRPPVGPPPRVAV